MPDPVRPRPDPIAALVEPIENLLARYPYDTTTGAGRAYTASVYMRMLLQDILAALRADADARPPQLPSWLTDRIKLPVRWNGTDLLDADNRVIVWGMPDGDHDDVDRALGRWVADALNAVADARPPQEERVAKMLADYADLLELIGREFNIDAASRFHRGFTVAEIRAAAVPRRAEPPPDAAKRLRDRLVAIREAAVKPSHDFNLNWQLGCFLNEFERAFGIRSSDLDKLAEPLKET